MNNQMFIDSSACCAALQSWTVVVVVSCVFRLLWVPWDKRVFIFFVQAFCLIIICAEIMLSQFLSRIWLTGSKTFFGVSSPFVMRCAVTCSETQNTGLCLKGSPWVWHPALLKDKSWLLPHTRRKQIDIHDVNTKGRTPVSSVKKCEISQD